MPLLVTFIMCNKHALMSFRAPGLISLYAGCRRPQRRHQQGQRMACPCADCRLAICRVPSALIEQCTLHLRQGQPLAFCMICVC